MRAPLVVVTAAFLMRVPLVLAALRIVCACGMGGAPAGGGANLPTLGVGPYDELKDEERATPLDEPYLVVDYYSHFGDPDVLPFGDGFRLWFTRTEKIDGALPEIWGATLPSLVETPSTPALVLSADLDWEAGVRAPSIVDRGAGELVLFYQGGGHIGRAESSDDGLSWTKESAPVLENALDPEAVSVDGAWVVFFSRPDAPGIFRAESADGLSFTSIPDPILLPRSTERDAFDRLWVGEPCVCGGRNEVGDLEVDLFFTGMNKSGEYSIGSAASQDGIHFARFGEEPILATNETDDERGCAVHLEPSQGILFFAKEKLGVWAIAGATHP